MLAARHFRSPWHTGRNQCPATALPRRTPRRVRSIIAGESDMRAHQPGSTPIDIPETVQAPHLSTLLINIDQGTRGQRMNLFAEFFDLGFVKNIALVFLDGDVVVEKDNAAQSEFTREGVQPFWISGVRNPNINISPILRV